MKFGRRSGNHIVDLLFTLALFCVFAATALLVVLIGANVYQKTVRQMDATFYERTSMTYVATKVRQNDVQDGVHLQDMDGVTALVLDTSLEGETFQTWIYHHDGALWETFVQAGTAVEPGSGQVILEVPDFRFEFSGNMLLLTSVDESGKHSSLWVTPRCAASLS